MKRQSDLKCVSAVYLVCGECASMSLKSFFLPSVNIPWHYPFVNILFFFLILLLHYLAFPCFSFLPWKTKDVVSLHLWHLNLVARLVAKKASTENA